MIKIYNFVLNTKKILPGGLYRKPHLSYVIAALGTKGRVRAKRVSNAKLGPCAKCSNKLALWTESLANR